MLSHKIPHRWHTQQKLNNSSFMQVPLTAGLFIRLHYIVVMVLCSELLCSTAIEVFLLAWRNPTLPLTTSQQWQPFSLLSFGAEKFACALFTVHVNLVPLQVLLLWESVNETLTPMASPQLLSTHFKAYCTVRKQVSVCALLFITSQFDQGIFFAVWLAVE